MLDIIMIVIVWVVIPIVFGIGIIPIIMSELDAEKRRATHRENLLDVINTSNMNEECKAEILCKFGDCRRK